MISFEQDRYVEIDVEKFPFAFIESSFPPVVQPCKRINPKTWPAALIASAMFNGCLYRVV